MFDPVFSKILVAYDGSEPAKNALEIAARMATIFKGEIIILTAVPPVTFPMFPTDGYSGVPPYQHSTTTSTASRNSTRKPSTKQKPM